MSREAEVAALLLDDEDMVALLPGGIYTDEQLGVEGIRRGAGNPSAAAFNEDGDLLTCAMVRQDSLNPVPGVRSSKDKISGTTQMVFIYFYERRGHSEIELAKQRSYEILEGVRLSDSYELIWEWDTPSYYDMGPVANSTALRQDWRVTGIRRPTP
jgi:hypothetical protein